MIQNKNILIIGGSGSLGYKLTEKYIEHNKIYIYSRDEYKHWEMKLKFSNNPNLNFIIGDINNYKRIHQTLIRTKFNIIILAAALKHIEKCETETEECLNTNILGTQNFLNIIELNLENFNSIENICYVSTDKACSPVNIYGMSKAISESLFIEKSRIIKNIKFSIVRYGNVLNSRGSIIPILHSIGKNNEIKNFKLTDEKMSRFLMTLEESVELINYAIISENNNSGDIIIPELKSCNIKDLIELFSEIYNKPIDICGLRKGEKLYESLINETQSLKVIHIDNYYIIKRDIFNCSLKQKDYNSKINVLSKEKLKIYLLDNKLIEYNIPKLLNLDFNFNKYLEENPFPYFIKENILEREFAIKCQEEILNIEDNKWDRYDNPFESKYTLRNKNDLPENINKLFKYLSSIYFINYLSNIFRVKIYNDPNKNWWGIHKYNNKDFLDIHCDAGIHPICKKRKYLTLGIYLSKNWKEENGGHLELWQGDSIINNHCKLDSCIVKILPSFNKLILFTCNDKSWHGNPVPVNIKNNEERIFLTISYLTDNSLQDIKNNNDKAYFIARPNDPINLEKDKLRKLRSSSKTCKNIYNLK